MADYNEEITGASNPWNINHNLNNDTPLVDAMLDSFGGEQEKAMPVSIVIVDADNITINWSGNQTGNVRVIG